MSSRSNPSGQTVRPPQSIARWYLLALLVVTVAAYWGVWNHQFINFDDQGYVTENQHVQQGLSWPGAWWALTTTEMSNWHPLTWLSLQLDYQFAGLKPATYHATNLLWHLANSGLLLFVLQRMTGALGRSAFVAALFALHPLHVESVAWVAERKDVLSTFFWLLTMAAYAYYVRRPGIGRYLLLALAFGLGLMAKPMLVTLPCVLLLLDFWPLERWPAGAAHSQAARQPPANWPGATGRRLLVEKLPLLVLTVACCLVTLLAQRHGGALKDLSYVPLGARVVNSLLAYVAYLRQCVLPLDLILYYPLERRSLADWQTWYALILLLGISLLVLSQWRHRRYLVTGWFWYLGTLVPVIGLVQVGGQAMADRYTYVPLIGIFIIFAWGGAELAARWHWPARLTRGAALALLLACALLTRRQVGYWHDSQTIWQHAVEAGPPDPTNLGNLGHALLERGRAAEAAPHFAEALRLDPDDRVARYDLAQAYVQLDDRVAAAREFAELLAREPENPDVHYNLAALLAQQGQVPAAVEHYAAVVRLDPDHLAARLNLGRHLLNQGELAEAERQLRAAVERHPESLPARRLLSAALVAEQRYAEAAQVDPDWQRAAAARAWRLATAADPQERRPAEALQLAQQVCQATDRGRPEYLDLLAACQAATGDFATAEKTARQALALAAASEGGFLVEGLRTRLLLYAKRQAYQESRDGEGVEREANLLLTPSQP